MKLSTVNNRIVVTADSASESIELVKYVIGARSEPKATKKYKKRKKYTITKKCGICGKECKGNQGLATHTSRSHKINEPYKDISTLNKELPQ